MRLLKILILGVLPATVLAQAPNPPEPVAAFPGQTDASPPRYAVNRVSHRNGG